jgi:hypothetical protein
MMTYQRLAVVGAVLVQAFLGQISAAYACVQVGEDCIDAATKELRI